MTAEENPKPIRLGVVEDHGVVREGLGALLAGYPEVEVVWMAESGEQGVLQVQETPPDLVLMDLTLPGINGIEATREIKTRFPDLRVLMLTVHDTDQHIRASFRAGADGYVLKDGPADELLSAIVRVAAGEKQMSARVTDAVLHGYLGTEEPQGLLAHLTDREREVLGWVGRGTTSREIGEQLGISSRTVEKHKANIMEKLEVRTSSALAALATRYGLA